MKRILWLLIFSLPLLMNAQQGYWIYFTDKNNVKADTDSYFDQKATEKKGFDRNAFTNLPLNERYVNIIENNVDEFIYASRWFNASAVYASEYQIEKIKKLAFVDHVDGPYVTEEIKPLISAFDESLSEYDSTLMINQLASLQGDAFRERGLNGKGVRIAIFDVGFPDADKNPAFETIRKEGRLIDTWDFTKKKKDVFYGKSHGTNVWSCIAGNVNGKQTGLATGAEFLLAKTEVNKEPFKEEVWWLAAAEWAYKNGADIINSSLGYTKDRYFTWDMDGKTSFVTRAANMAARNGILVVNAAGNEGSDSWHTIGAPADADSVLSIGGIDPDMGYHIDFSSYGPTADKRMKPNVSAFGKVVVSNEGGFKQSQGTSFASPLVAGFAACALQAHPEFDNMQLFKAIERSGTLYPYFDYAHGFGIPQAERILNEKSLLTVEPTFKLDISDDTLHIILLTTDPEKKEYFYYNLTNSDNIITKYYVLTAAESEVLSIPLWELDMLTINMHYKGYTLSYDTTKE